MQKPRSKIEDQSLNSKLISDIEHALNTLIRKENRPFRTLFEAGRYALLNGGKRLRPLLTLLTCDMLGGQPHQAMAPAIAVEMIHTYSLIHDDLPCMDDDDYRRGNPTLHKVYSEAQAVLTGDYLLTLAFEIIANEEALSAEQRIDMIQCLSKASGAYGLIGGQVVDVLENHTTLDELKELHLNKTGALFSAAVQLGAISANASKDKQKQLALFGSQFGLAYQILNDILDVSSSKALRGCEVSSDVKNGKVTIVTHLGIEEARKEYEEMICRCLNILDKMDEETDELKRLLSSLSP